MDLLQRAVKMWDYNEVTRLKLLRELVAHLSSAQTNSALSQEAIHYPQIVGAIVTVCDVATRSKPTLVLEALKVLVSLASSLRNARVLFQKHPNVLGIQVARMETPDKVPREAMLLSLDLAKRLAVVEENRREVVCKFPRLLPALACVLQTKGAYDNEPVHLKVLTVLRFLAVNDENEREMAPMLLPILVARLEAGGKKKESHEMQIGMFRLLANLVHNAEYRRGIWSKYPALVQLIINKLGTQGQVEEEDGDEEMKAAVLGVLPNLTYFPENKRDMVTHFPDLVPALLRELGANSSPGLAVHAGVLDVLCDLVSNAENATEILSQFAFQLLPLLVNKMDGGTLLATIRVVYNLSCPASNQPALRENSLLVSALLDAKLTSDAISRELALLTLINLFGYMDSQSTLVVEADMLQDVFSLLQVAGEEHDLWQLNDPLLAFKQLCIVDANRKLIWQQFGSEFLHAVVSGLQQAIASRDVEATESAVLILLLFSSEPGALEWMGISRALLEQLLQGLENNTETFKTGQLLMIRLDLAQPTPPLVTTFMEEELMVASKDGKSEEVEVEEVEIESIALLLPALPQDNKVELTPIRKPPPISVQVTPLALSAVLSNSNTPSSPSSPSLPSSPVATTAKVVRQPELVMPLSAPNTPLQQPETATTTTDKPSLPSPPSLSVEKPHSRPSSAQQSRIILPEPIVTTTIATAAAAAAPKSAEKEKHMELAVATTAGAKRAKLDSATKLYERLGDAENGEAIADKLINSGLVLASHLEMLHHESLVDIKQLLDLTPVQVLVLKKALRDVFGK
ncbi:hypothetical protein BASA81_010145 [Batrachochytrium salamandrivorans]|nr:hypothetical protein BASA81_010145 [Batrachochytrium salamandrivorans]